MQAEYEPDETKPCNAWVCFYFAFLLLPLITLVLLQTTVWHQNNSECDPFTPTYVFVPPMTADIEGVVKLFERFEYRKGKCTCLVEYPRYMYILAGFEILVFVYLCVYDFENCVHTTQRLFDGLICEAVAQERVLQSSKVRRYSRLCSPDCESLRQRESPSFDADSFAHLANNASTVLGTLTRSDESVFTRLVGKSISNTCRRIALAYSDTISFHSCYGTRSADEDTHLVFDYEHLCDQMRSSVRSLFSGIMPVSLPLKNCSFTAALTSQNFRVFDCHPATVMSLRQYQEFMLVLCMGSHERLGSTSKLCGMHDDLLRQISVFILMPWDRALSVLIQRGRWLF